MAKEQANYPGSLDVLNVDRQAGQIVTSNSYDIIEDAITKMQAEMRRVTAKTATATLTANEGGMILVSCAVTPYSLFLPSAVGNNGLVYDIIKTDDNTNLITIDADGTETINGQLTFTDLNYQYARIKIKSNNANWIIVTTSHTSTVRVDNLISPIANSINVKPDGDTDDFFSFKSLQDRPTIKREGGKFIYFESSNVYDVGISFRLSDTYSGTLNYEKDNHMMTVLGKNSPFGFKANSDYVNYLKVQTVSSIPEITVVASSGLKINAGGTNALLLNHAGGNVGIGETTPTAVLHLKAGTASASTAPLKFASGVLLTTPEAGAMEFLTDTFYGTITSGAARKAFAFRTDKLSAFAATTSAELKGVISDETGSGGLVFATSPTLVTPTLGAAIATSLDVRACSASGVDAEQIRMGRSDTQIRYHSIHTKSAAIDADNYMQFLIHDKGESPYTGQNIVFTLRSYGAEINAETDADAHLLFTENETTKWDIYNDHNDDALQIKAGSTLVVEVESGGDVEIKNNLTVGRITSLSGTTGSLAQNASEIIMTAVSPNGSVWKIYAMESGNNTIWNLEGTVFFRTTASPDIVIHKAVSANIDLTATDDDVYLKNLHANTVALKWTAVRVK